MLHSPILLPLLLFISSCARHSHPSEKLTKGRSQESIASLMTAKNRLAAECMVKSSEPGKDIRGRLVLKFKIETSGHVSNVKAVENTTQSSRLEKCMVETFSKTDFDAGYPPTEIQWPWVFRE